MVFQADVCLEKTHSSLERLRFISSEASLKWIVSLIETHLTETSCKFQSTALCHATWLHCVAWCHLFRRVDTACAPEVNKATWAVAVYLIAVWCLYVLDVTFVFHFLPMFHMVQAQVFTRQITMFSWSLEVCFFLCLILPSFLPVCHILLLRCMHQWTLAIMWVLERVYF